MSDFITVAELRIEAERLCDENERLEAENAELRNDADLLRAMLSQERLEKQCYMAENAELQETLQRRTEQFEGMTEMWGERGVENFKLRELVRDYIDAPCTTCDCWQDEFRCWNYDGADCGLVARARDLGVEVD